MSGKSGITSEQARIVEYMGFEVCEFPPDNDTCEGCKEPGLQLYFQGPTDAGHYLCLDCIMLENSENQKDCTEIVRLHKEEGHSSHCAARMVWGDGQCECKPCACCNGTGKIKETEFVDGDEYSCMTCNGKGS